MPSVQLLTYLTLRGEGCSVATAAEETGIGIDEAWLHEEDIKSGALELPTPERPRTSISVNGGPKVPVDLDKGLDHPDNAAARDETAKLFASRTCTREKQSTKESEMVNGTVAGDELKLLIERIERLTEEIKALNEDKSEVFKEAKDRGFDTATMKRVIKLRKMDDSTRDEAEALLGTYLSALGMTPIEHAIAMAA